MGVRGLTSFLDSLPAAWKDVEMKKPAGDAVRLHPFPPIFRPFGNRQTAADRAADQARR
jgi:hypothetical protein